MAQVLNPMLPHVNKHTHTALKICVPGEYVNGDKRTRLLVSQGLVY